MSPILAGGDDDSSESDFRVTVNDGGGRKMKCDVEEPDERPRHALVVSCAPEQGECVFCGRVLPS